MMFDKAKDILHKFNLKLLMYILKINKISDFKVFMTLNK